MLIPQFLRSWSKFQIVVLKVAELLNLSRTVSTLQGIFTDVAPKPVPILRLIKPFKGLNKPFLIKSLFKKTKFLFQKMFAVEKDRE